MKVHIWSEQSDSFEMGLLEQVATLAPIDLGDEPQAPVVLLGRGLAAPQLKAVTRLTGRIYLGRHPLILLPPFSDRNLRKYFEFPAEVTIAKRKPTATVQVVDAGLAERVGGDLVVRSDDYIATSLVGVVARDDARQPVILRFAPRSTAAPVIIVTLQLLSYTALTNEEDRQRLLAVLLDHSFQSAAHRAPEIEIPDRAAPPRQELAPLLVGLAALGHVDTPRLSELLASMFGQSISDGKLEEMLLFLEKQTIIRRAGAERIIDRTALEAILEELGMSAYARELRELLQEQPLEVAR
jgi:hypothetical protein